LQDGKGGPLKGVARRTVQSMHLLLDENLRSSSWLYSGRSPLIG
jgi:hypothetical protein